MVSAAHRHKLFIFDLDGTLINSRADIALSLNLALARVQMPGLTEERISDFVGEGVPKLVQRALRAATGREPGDELVQTVIRLFREEYGNHLLDHTRLCPGAEEALKRLSWAKFAVVTNKPEGFSRRILDGLGIGDRFQSILGGDSVENRKPHPEALLKAISVCDVTPAETVMIGDSGVDIQAGKAAGVLTCGVMGGFRPRQELEASRCDLLIESLWELPDHFLIRD